MTTPDAEAVPDDVERIAKAFHVFVNITGPDGKFVERGQPDLSAVPWADVPDNNKALMRSVVLSMLEQGFIFTAHSDGSAAPS